MTTTVQSSSFSTSEFLHATHGCSSVVELRAFEARPSPGNGDAKVVWSGLYNNLDTMAEHAESLTESPEMKAIYYTLNSITVDRFGSVANLYEKSYRTTRDSDTRCRQSMLVDSDPNRPSHTNATDAEKFEAEKISIDCRDHLTSIGWPLPIEVDSGNGRHLLYRMMPGIVCNTQKSSDTLRLALSALDSMFGNDKARIDTTVFNGARISRLPGTWNRKGIDSPERPWRRAECLSIPPIFLGDNEKKCLPANRVTQEQIDALALLAPKGVRRRDRNYVDGSGMKCAVEGATVFRGMAPSSGVVGWTPQKALEHQFLNWAHQNQRYLPDICMTPRRKEHLSFFDMDGCPFNGGVPHNGSSDKTSLVVGDWLGFSCFSDHKGHAKYTFGDLEDMLDDKFGQLREGVIDGWGEIEDVFGQATEAYVPKHVIYDVTAPEEEYEEPLSDAALLKILGGRHEEEIPDSSEEDESSTTEEPETAEEPCVWPVAKMTNFAETFPAQVAEHAASQAQFELTDPDDVASPPPVTRLVEDDPDPYVAPVKPAVVLNPYTAPVQKGKRGSLNIPLDAMYGWLGVKVADLQSPDAWGYCSLITLAASLMGTEFAVGQIRPTLYTALLGGVGSGKSTTMKRARRKLALGDEEVVTRVPASDQGLFKMFAPTKEGESMFSRKSQLLLQDELWNLMQKMQIQGSSLPSCLCSLYYENEAGTATKSSKAGGDGITVQLSILGGLVIKDHLDFRRKFGSETSAGLYDRFCFAVGPPTWEFDDQWEDFDAAKPERRAPVKVQRPCPQYLFDQVREFRNAECADPALRRRIGELIYRVSLITTAFNKETVISRECVDAAVAFGHWQEKIKTRFQPGTSENLDGLISGEILDRFGQPHLIGQWTDWTSMARGQKWSRTWGASSVIRARDALVDGGEMETCYLTDEDGKPTRTSDGTYRVCE